VAFIDASGLAQQQALDEQPGNHRLVTDPEPGDRGVVGNGVRGDHPVGHVLSAPPLDHPGRSFALTVGIQQQRQHHRRLVRRPAPPIRTVSGIQPGQVQQPGPRCQESAI
jgi:hypothetical protein